MRLVWRVRLAMSEVEKQRDRRAYKRGYMFELTVRDRLEKAGFNVLRCSGSKPIDLIAISKAAHTMFVALIECKIWNESYSQKMIIDEVKKLRETYGLDAIFVLKDAGGIAWFIAPVKSDIPEVYMYMLLRALGTRHIIIGDSYA